MQRQAIYLQGTDNVTKDYTASNTELYFEDICKVFNTQLQPAEVYSSLLTRRSVPSTFENPDTGVKLAQFQLTRFSPMHSDNWFDVYSEIRKSKYPRRKPIEEHGIAYDEVMDGIRRKHKVSEPDEFLMVTDNNYIPDLRVGRFEKEMYFAVFNLGRRPKEEELKPFNVFDANRYNASPRLADVWICYYRSPVYEGVGIPPNVNSDFIRVEFPLIRNMQSKSESEASKACPLDEISITGIPVMELPVKIKTPTVESHTYEINPRMPTGYVMGFLQQYVKSLCGLV
ncbi:MAG: hypothetical protein V1731_03405 [Candidatus Aenigmatarchaeota archaeon]